MIFFSEITPDSEEYNFVELLFLSAFPDEERRPEADQRENVSFNPFMHCMLLTDVDDTPLGFLNYWDFGSFVYIEHFAIAPNFRCQGIGGEALSVFLEMQHRPVVVEAELPTSSPVALRRIGFYLRNGFVQLAEPYFQPSYPGRESEPVPMLLLLYAEEGRRHPSARQMKNQIYREVYGISPSS
ncbi:MAG: GNAT family N-acetyltransferase [Paludibacteraceae bacterium]|nr:GNAT family N-acetyltransferase [Paludibacteraceae bacterium]